MTTATAAPSEEDVDAPNRSKKKLVIIAAVLLLVGGGCVYQFLIRPSDDAAAVPGVVVPLDHVQINLAEGHYLRLGLSLQLTADAEGEGHGGEFDGSKALDAAIEVFSGRSVAEVAKGGQRARLKKQLVKRLTRGYHGDVMDVYFTEFVTE